MAWSQMKILTKKQMYALYESGAFGNHLRLWSDLDSFLKSDYQGSFTLRYRGTSPGYFGLYNITRETLQDRLSEAAKEKPLELARITVNESAPDDRLLIQGEVQRGIYGLELTYSQEKVKMRIGMENPSFATGLKAVLILKHFMSPDDWDDLNLLLDTYEGAVVEFSTYEMDLGSCPHRRTIFWEVRHY